jgi:RNA polymerase sigma-70 factor, ECF subfamily
MTPGPGLVRFLAALPAVLREHAEQDPETASLWSAGLARARQDWPDLGVEAEAFAEHVAARLASVEELRTLAWSDLYLAFACARADPGALAAFEEVHLAALGPRLGRIGLSPDAVDEVRQDLRVRLLAGEPGKRPEIERYTGRGTLRGWLTVMAAHRAQKRLAGERRQRTTSDEALVSVFDPAAEPALAYVKGVHRADLKEAIEASLAGLTARERNLLRHQLVDGLTIDQIGLRYGVHRATAARWVGRARQRLIGATRKRLMKRLGQTREEVDSLIQFVRSRVDLSLERLLPGDEPEK